MKDSLKIICGLSVSLLTAASCNGQPEDKLPNIVIILADDLGYGDLSCYGSTRVRTPELDNLATEGARLINFYANGPVCTPTRVALLTGRYQQRVGGLETAIGIGNVGRYTEAVELADNNDLGLPVEFNALPAILKEKGYNTAIIGKWHLGYEEKFSPQAHHFDYSLGPVGGLIDYFHHNEPGAEEGSLDNTSVIYRNGEPHPSEGYYVTHLITDESVEWINRQKHDKPFFLYVPYTAPHNPFQGPDDYSPERMKNWKAGEERTYIEMIEAMDEGIGKILNKLSERSFDDNTLVVFFSDNGPVGQFGDAGPFSGFKGSVFEGGIRVPCIIRWPGMIEAGMISGQMAIGMDLTASITRIIDGNPPKPLDGKDIVGHLTSQREDFPRTLFWRTIRGENIRKAVRDNNMKYIRNNNDGNISEFLFNLDLDPAEKTNLKDLNTNDFERLKKMLEDWEQDVKAERYQVIKNN